MPRVREYGVCMRSNDMVRADQTGCYGESMARDVSAIRATVLLILVPILGLVAGVAGVALLGLGGTNVGTSFANVCFLAAIVAAVAGLGLSRADLGLRIITGRLTWHAVASSVVLGLYVLFYLLVIRIAEPKPLSPEIAWGLVAYGLVAVGEELYFRGALYGFLERRFSPRAALIGTSLLFGLFHLRQGGAAIARIFTGWLWSSVRYTSGMIFLLIPVHFVYNATALLFVGGWSDPPIWGVIGLPLAELLLGLAFVMVRIRRHGPVGPSGSPGQNPVAAARSPERST